MFVSAKRHEREKQEILAAGSRLTEAILASIGDGLFLLGAEGKVLPPVSRALAALFRRHDFTEVSIEQLFAPLVTAKALSAIRTHVAALLGGAAPTGATDSGTAHAAAVHAGAAPAPDLASVTQFFSDIEVRLPNPDGSFQSAHYAFEFDPVELEPFERGAPGLWLVRVTDITTRLHINRELDELRGQIQTQSEILRGILRLGGVRFAALMRSTDASMKSIATVLKKPAREAQAFRLKLEAIFREVNRIRGEAGAFGLTALQSAARAFEEALEELRSRSTLSGSDFLPLAIKMDQLYDQFALLLLLTAASPALREADTPAEETPAHRSAPSGSLGRALQALTDHVAQTCDKQVRLECSGLHLVPQRYQATVKNVAIQLIRNALMHGIESPEARAAAGKPAHGRLRLEFKAHADGFELQFNDDGCGLDADAVRSTAIAHGAVTAEAAARMRDREAIKLIFNSRYTTLSRFTEGAPHGAGMALVRRHVQDAGGKVALASVPGRETRFRITLPPLTAAGTDAAPEVEAAAVSHAAAAHR